LLEKLPDFESDLVPGNKMVKHFKAWQAARKGFKAKDKGKEL